MLKNVRSCARFRQKNMEKIKRKMFRKIIYIDKNKNKSRDCIFSMKKMTFLFKFRFYYMYGRIVSINLIAELLELHSYKPDICIQNLY